MYRIFMGYDIHEVDGEFVVSKAGVELKRVGTLKEAMAWVRETL